MLIPNHNQGRCAIYSCCDNYNGDKTKTPVVNDPIKDPSTNFLACLLKKSTTQQWEGNIAFNVLLPYRSLTTLLIKS